MGAGVDDPKQIVVNCCLRHAVQPVHMLSQIALESLKKIRCILFKSYDVFDIPLEASGPESVC